MKNRAECIREYGSDYFIRKKLESGELYLIEKGIYNDRSYVPELALLTRYLLQLTNLGFSAERALQSSPSPISFLQCKDEDGSWWRQREERRDCSRHSAPLC